MVCVHFTSLHLTFWDYIKLLLSCDLKASLSGCQEIIHFWSTRSLEAIVIVLLFCILLFHNPFCHCVLEYTGAATFICCFEKNIWFICCLVCWWWYNPCKMRCGGSKTLHLQGEPLGEAALQMIKLDSPEAFLKSFQLGIFSCFLLLMKQLSSLYSCSFKFGCRVW